MAFTSAINRNLTFIGGQVVVATDSKSASTIGLGAGQLLIGTSTTTPPMAAALVAGSGVQISSGAGSVTISATASGVASPTTTLVTNATTAAWGNTYIMKANVVLTIPTPTSVGQTITIVGGAQATAAGYTITGPNYYQMNVGAAYTTANPSSLVSTGYCDAVTFIVESLATASTANSGSLVATASIGQYTTN